MDLDHYVIIGNGPAGNHAAFTLRENDKDARITIISDENLAFYSKPKLTRFIADKISEADLTVPVDPDYASLDIEVRLGQKVERIDTASKTLYLEHQETVQYTKLIIAAGSKARVLPGMKNYADHLKFIGSYTDVKAYKDQIRSANDVFIFGGDLVAFKFIRLLRSMEKNVTVLLYPYAFWPHTLTQEMTDAIRVSLQKQSVIVVTHDDIDTIEKLNHQYQITTTKNAQFTVDLVFSFNGLTPEIDFVKGSGIDYDHGILVDDYLKTNIEDIYACGSCAQIYNPDIGNHMVSIGWPNAVAQGQAAAANLLGARKGVVAAGRKYFDLEGVKIKMTWWDDITASGGERG